jgi:hypothetical protein
VKDHPKNGMIHAPGNRDGEHTSEAPKTYACRPTSVFHVVSSIVFLCSRAEAILHPAALYQFM